MLSLGVFAEALPSQRDDSLQPMVKPWLYGISLATFSAFPQQMQFVIVSEAELVDKLREL
jgi:hypothetical protein